MAGPRTTIRPVAGLPLLHLDHPELAGGKQIVKSVFDKAVAAAALVGLAPLFAAIALMIWLADRGPVFFRQTRVGKDGTAFTLCKFRTMVVDAERWKPLLAAHNEADDVLFKIRRDPRITRAGRLAAPLVAGRAAAAVQRADRRHVPGRPAGPRCRRRPRATAT